MPTVLREAGLRFVIYLDDHGPAHVHVFGDGETKVAIDRPAIVRIVGAPASESRRALRIVRERQAMLLERWEDIHG